MCHDDKTKRRTGALAMGLLLAVTIAAAGCESHRDTQVVDTPEGRTVTSTETTGIDREQIDAAKQQTKDAAGKVADQAGKMADQVGTAAQNAKGDLTDAGLTAKVKARLGTDSRVHAGTIDVDTSGRVVTLKGTVGSDAERRAAVDIAQGTAGVSSVVDQLTVASK